MLAVTVTTLESPDVSNYAAHRSEYRGNWEPWGVNDRAGIVYINVLYSALTVFNLLSLVYKFDHQ